MRTEDIESWQFSAIESAKILGWSERQFANWTKRYSPFPHKKAGRGRSISYDLSDLMKLSAIGHLVAHGLTPEKAFEAYAPYGGPYGSLLHNASTRHPYPGTTTFTRNSDGRWIGVLSPRNAIAIQVMAWPIFDEIFPRFKKAILADPRTVPRSQLQTTLEEFEKMINQLRRDRWSGSEGTV